MGLSKRGAPWSVVKPKSPLASISRVASPNAPSSTSNSGAAPSRTRNGASSATAQSATAAREGGSPCDGRAVPGCVGGGRGLRGGAVGLGMARLEVDADEQLGEDARREELQPAEDAEEPEREQRPAADALAEELQGEEVAQDRGADREDPEAEAAEEVARSGAELEEEDDRDEVDEDAERAREAVLRLAVGAPVVRDRLLRHPLRRGHGREPGGDEAMHLAIEPHLAEHRRPERLEAAAEILEREPGHPPDEPVRERRGDAAEEEPVLAVAAPARDEVEVLAQQPPHEPRDVGRVVLEVAVHRDDDVPAGGVDARLHRGGLPVVAQEPHDPHVRPEPRRPGEERLPRPVAAAVVHGDELPRARVRRERRLDAVEQRGDVLDLVVHRNDDREPVRRKPGARCGGGRRGLEDGISHGRAPGAGKGSSPDGAARPRARSRPPRWPSRTRRGGPRARGARSRPRSARGGRRLPRRRPRTCLAPLGLAPGGPPRARHRACRSSPRAGRGRSEEHTSELQSRENLVCRLLLEKKKKKHNSFLTRKKKNKTTKIKT